ncbi:MAG: hypothetical protein CHACPFDD_01040 [Phycisphaerae bacterium]|nr:hypothetical protein [Phycisphaerae bacterium]
MKPIRTSTAACLLLGLATGGPGCGSERARLQSLSPVERAAAIIDVVRVRDRQAVPKLVGLLEDPDRGVRMFAITALVDLCGDDFGYRYFAAEAQRADAVARWREALRTGQVRVVPAADPPTSAPASGEVTLSHP